MARIDLNVPILSEKFIDIRETIPGDSFNWSWTRPLSQVNYLAIHHTAGPDTQTPDQIALFHINNNGWTGIGYHFLITRDGTVYYVGDISTARANVANLNDQVLGICLIGSFISGKNPTDAQIDSTHKICDFFINNYPVLTNVTSWDSVRGHKELPGQSTVCPGDNWPVWKQKVISGITVAPIPTLPPSVGGPVGDRGAQITELYRVVLGRDPDMGGLQAYTNSNMTIDEIRKSMIESVEHQNIIGNSKQVPLLREQINGLQQTVASLQLVNQPIPTLPPSPTPPPSPPPKLPVDTTLTLPEVLANIFKFLFVKREDR